MRRFVPILSLLALTLSLALVLAWPRPGARRAAAQTANAVPLFGNLGAHHRAVTTTSPTAQRYFDQGLTLTFSFNHGEAIRSFQEAARRDPTCAMAWWGLALANGPHINNPAMDSLQSVAAWDALQHARALRDGASPVERELIDALSARYASPVPADRAPLDAAYAEAMRALWRAHPDDADIGTLFAEAAMDLHPWDFWNEKGEAKQWTPEIVTTLEQVLALAPRQPGANHYYIHVVEASAHPERGVKSADRLRTLVPGAGHMVHMPAHIYSRVGRWADASEQNVRAIAVDAAYRRRSPRQGFYRIYMAHNHHFLAWSSMMEGRSAVALRAAREMLAGMPASFVQEMAFFADGYMTIEYESLMRFGRWDEILATPQPPAYLPITTTQWHFARAVALAATNRLEDARREEKAFEEAKTHVTDEMIVGNNSAKHVLSIAENVLDGEIAYREGKIDDAVAKLTKAVELEDQLRYDEAPDWIQPVRHTLGGVLLGAGRAGEAEAVYRADLVHNPENGWALWGLAQSLRAGGKTAEAQKVEARYKKAWRRADVPLQATCFCIRKAS